MEDQLPCLQHLPSWPHAARSLLLVEVRISLEHDKHLGRVDPHVLGQAIGIQKLVPTGVTGIEDVGVGVCGR